MESFQSILKLLSFSATFAIMFGGALRIRPETLRQVSQNPRLFFRTLFVVWVAVPIFTALVIVTLGVDRQSASLILLMSVCPGVPLLLGTTRTVRGAMATAFLALVITAATEPLMIPFWTRFLSKFFPMNLTVQPKHVLDVLLPMVFLPIALGFVIRDASPRATAILIRISDFFYVIGVIASVIVILLKGMPLIEALLPPIAIFATLIITVSDAAFGYWAGSPNLEDRKAVALAAALGNPALALAVVEVSYPELQAEVLVTVYLVIRGIAMIPIEWWLKKKPPKIAEVSSQ